MITLNQLRIFVKVAELQHVTRAAEELNLTQPAVTAQMRALEHAFAVDLIEPVGRRIRLTGAGRIFYEEARQVLLHVEALERSMDDLAHLRSGHLAVGATLSIGEYLLPQLLATLKQQYPQIQTSALIANTATIEERLLDYSLDLGLVEWEIRSEELEVIPWIRDELVVIVPPNHPWLAGEAEAITVEQLVQEPFVAREVGSGTRALTERRLGAAAKLNIVLELNNTNAIKQAVQVGIGVAIMSATLVTAELQRGQLRQLRVTGLDLGRHFSLVYRKGRSISPPAQAFIHLIEDWMQQEKAKN